MPVTISNGDTFGCTNQGCVFGPIEVTWGTNAVCSCVFDLARTAKGRWRLEQVIKAILGQLEDMRSLHRAYGTPGHAQAVDRAVASGAWVTQQEED